MFGLGPLESYLASSLIQNILTGLVNNLVTAPVPQTIQISGNMISTNIRETQDSYLLEAYLPGATKESVNVKYIDNYLTITGNVDQYVQNGYGGYVRYLGNLNRSFYIEDIDSEKIDGNIENGVLKLILPKIKKQVKDQ